MASSDFNLFVDRIQEEIWDEDVPEGLKTKLLSFNGLLSRSRSYATWKKFEFEGRRLVLYSSDFELDVNPSNGMKLLTLVTSFFVSSRGELVVEIT